MLTLLEAQLVASLFYTLDKKVRHDLHRNRIADERDCVSRLVDSFSHPYGLLNQYAFRNLHFQSKWFSRVNIGDHEQTFGCDSMLVFRVDNHLKVGLFEAKWPRVVCEPTYRWDYPQKSTKKSHFTHQIRRQAAWTTQAAIWEMFFYEADVDTHNPPFDAAGATCIRHEVAKELVDSQPGLEILWDNTNLQDLINLAQRNTSASVRETNLRAIVQDMLTCDFGEAIPIGPSDNYFILATTDASARRKQVRCPVLTFVGDEESQPFIDDFMATNGLTFFQQVDIRRTHL